MARLYLIYWRLTSERLFFSDDRLERQKGSDIMWYIWTAPYSPLYGRNKMATFERYFIDDDDMKIEKKKLLL